MQQQATITGNHLVITSNHAAAAHADDLQLAAACTAGDPKGFEEVYRRFGSRMKSIAYHHLGTMAEAEDAVQESFLKMHRAAATYSGEAAFATWAYRIVVNTCYDLIRRRHRRPEETPIEDGSGRMVFDQHASTVDDAKRMTLSKLLSELPEQKRTVFSLFEIEGLSHAEIAAILGITEGNSKWILFATKKELQEKWRGKQ